MSAGMAQLLQPDTGFSGTEDSDCLQEVVFSLLMFYVVFCIVQVKSIRKFASLFSCGYYYYYLLVCVCVCDLLCCSQMQQKGHVSPCCSANYSELGTRADPV